MTLFLEIDRVQPEERKTQAPSTHTNIHLGPKPTASARDVLAVTTVFGLERSSEQPRRWKQYGKSSDSALSVYVRGEGGPKTGRLKSSGHLGSPSDSFWSNKRILNKPIGSGSIDTTKVFFEIQLSAEPSVSTLKNTYHAHQFTHL